MRGNQSLILEGLANKEISGSDILEGVKADVRNKKEALMVIELLMKDFKISLEEVKSLFESAEPVSESSEVVEIKNTIEKCARTPESITSTLNSSDWIEGKDWKKAAGSNDKKIRLKGTDSFGNVMFLIIQF